MTTAEHLAALDARCAALETRCEAAEARAAAAEKVTELFTRGESDDGRVPFLMLNGRLGICTTYWAKKPFGEGATLSVGTAIDRFAAYFEVDEVTCREYPSVAVYASVTCGNPYGQKNIALEGVATNAPDVGGISQNYGLALTLGDRQVLVHRQAIQLAGDDMSRYVIARTVNDIRQLWP